MKFTAQYRTWCGNCDGTIAPGDMIEPGAEGRFDHVECDPAPRRPEVVCPDCFMVKPCECDDE